MIVRSQDSETHFPHVTMLNFVSEFENQVVAFVQYEDTIEIFALKADENGHYRKAIDEVEKYCELMEIQGPTVIFKMSNRIL